MSEQITEILTPLVLALVTALVSVLTVAITAGKTLAINWLQARTSAAQQEVIGRIAREAMAYAEKYAIPKGVAKLDEAMDYAAQELRQRGINVDSKKLRGVIEAAWMEHNKTIAPKTTLEITTDIAKVETT
ncbi:phage holin, LLH family [Paenibacillus sp. FJAT-26967]|uniref:phage holin, LLH family n=1 Tax=Paenibacillus sp. FJAT-26967 TaxID=1729690 RepID=UPI0008395A72|nr:phage holin, LLH family [Paenibacillus sp. FJAT-26967]